MENADTTKIKKFTDKYFKDFTDKYFTPTTYGVLGFIGGTVVTLFWKYTHGPLRYAASLNKTPTEAMIILEQANLLKNTKFSYKEPHKSIRLEDVEWIKERLERKITPGVKEFPVVVGQRGIGKTTAVRTAADGLSGIIMASDVLPGTNANVIIKEVLSGINGTLSNSAERALKVIESYKKITDGKVPIIIIPAYERLSNQNPAELTAAGRVLTDRYGLNVLIDASENAMPHVLSGREEVLKMKPMEDSMMLKLPQFKELFDYLTKTGNDKVILAVCSGKPLLINSLNLLIKKADEKDKELGVRDFVEEEIRKTRTSITHLVITYPKIGEVCKIKLH
jgi:hypothetical protein